MKKCPYCGYMAEDDAVKCKKCKAGFPLKEQVKEEEKYVKTKRSFRTNKEDKE